MLQICNVFTLKDIHDRSVSIHCLSVAFFFTSVRKFTFSPFWKCSTQLFDFEALLHTCQNGAVHVDFCSLAFEKKNRMHLFLSLVMPSSSAFHLHT